MVIGGLIQLLAAPPLVAVLFDALAEQLQRLVLLAAAVLAVRADAEPDGVGPPPRWRRRPLNGR
ncbi:hypothetical protein [Streptomyces xiamenensis]|uniref:hypothetical protein n=1 Tax=Streptomyces xiamenensis TaxID=408015 RepID=UPI0035DC5E93